MDILAERPQTRTKGGGFTFPAIEAGSEYVYLVPHVEEVEYVFLKTIIPSRKAVRDYREKGGK